jgi:hypothetical protein
MQYSWEILYCYLWLVRLYTIFPHWLINSMIFKEKKLLNIKYVFWVSLQMFSETFIVLRRTERLMIKNDIGLNVKYRLFLWDVNKTWIFSTYFREILKHQISWTSFQWNATYSLQMDRLDRLTWRAQLALVAILRTVLETDDRYSVSCWTTECYIKRDNSLNTLLSKHLKTS